MSFQHPAQFNYQGFTILQSGAICAAATLIGQTFLKLFWGHLLSRERVLEHRSEQSIAVWKMAAWKSVSPEMCILWGWYRCLENVKKLM